MEQAFNNRQALLFFTTKKLGLYVNNKIYDSLDCLGVAIDLS